MMTLIALPWRETEKRPSRLVGGQTEYYRRSIYILNLLPQVKIEIITRDNLVGKCKDHFP